MLGHICICLTFGKRQENQLVPAMMQQFLIELRSNSSYRDISGLEGRGARERRKRSQEGAAGENTRLYCEIDMYFIHSSPTAVGWLEAEH